MRISLCLLLLGFVVARAQVIVKPDYQRYDPHIYSILNPTLSSEYQSYANSMFSSKGCTYILLEQGFMLTASHCLHRTPGTSFDQAVRQRDVYNWPPGVFVELAVKGLAQPVPEASALSSIAWVILDSPAHDVVMLFNPLYARRGAIPFGKISQQKINPLDTFFVFGFGQRDNKVHELWEATSGPKSSEKALSVAPCTGMEKMSERGGCNFYLSRISFGGDSGGPVFDRHMNLVGIAHSRFSDRPEIAIVASLSQLNDMFSFEELARLTLRAVKNLTYDYEHWAAWPQALHKGISSYLHQRAWQHINTLDDQNPTKAIWMNWVQNLGSSALEH